MLWCAEMITTVYPVATQWQLALEIGSNETSLLSQCES